MHTVGEPEEQICVCVTPTRVNQRLRQKIAAPGLDVIMTRRTRRTKKSIAVAYLVSYLWILSASYYLKNDLNKYHQPWRKMIIRCLITVAVPTVAVSRLGPPFPRSQRCRDFVSISCGGRYKHCSPYLPKLMMFEAGKSATFQMNCPLLQKSNVDRNIFEGLGPIWLVNRFRLQNFDALLHVGSGNSLQELHVPRNQSYARSLFLPWVVEYTLNPQSQCSQRIVESRDTNCCTTKTVIFVILKR